MGLWHGLFIIIERLTGLHKGASSFITFFLARIYMLIIVLIGWVFFRAVDLTYAIDFLQGMVGIKKGLEIHTIANLENVNLILYLTLAIAFISSMSLFRTIFLENHAMNLLMRLNKFGFCTYYSFLLQVLLLQPIILLSILDSN